ncbi:Peptide/nickel transport system permease protein [Georgfuchsia toluolica]|uniref:Peptide/nickel transport system permease protein n=1 Tax=Georgfuchsia toluolica TaxID=424218 RepID=A0A916J6W4_9PROT|nr:ABC transporter permease [Georgfuchsia toluolica]CAG4885331.1 Peptide/nickel transport system permease protein [Georgfuchsia toluolica]
MLGIKPVLLASDALLLVLLLGSVALAWSTWHSEPLRAAWRRVGGNRTGMASATLLALFVVVGLLDSLHYRPVLPTVNASVRAEPVLSKAEGPVEAQYSVEVLSALDAVLMPLRTNTEKTYSAPLATNLFSMDVSEDGMTRVFPRLKHGGAGLATSHISHGLDVAQRVLKGATLGGGAWFAIWAAIWLWRRRPKEVPVVNDRAAVMGRLRPVLGVLLAVALCGGIVAELAGGYHVLGTDKVGQDVLYLSLKSIRTGLLLGTLTTLIMLPAAVLLGILAGYVGGWVDDAIQYLYTTLNSIPDVLLIAAAILMMQVFIDTHPGWFSSAAERADARLLALCIIMGVTSWTGLCRLLRGETLKLRELEYVQAAQAFGISRLTVMLRHILPNLAHIVLITMVMDFSRLVLAEAVLSYVGVGVDPSTISFGTMIDAARMELAREPMVWWSLAAAFSFMFALVLAANLFADAVRDAFDPKNI